MDDLCSECKYGTLRDLEPLRVREGVLLYRKRCLANRTIKQHYTGEFEDFKTIQCPDHKE